MSEVLKVKAIWSGISGGTGHTTLHVIDQLGTGLTVGAANDAHSRVRLFFENTSEWLPNDVTVSFPAAMDVIDSDTGRLERVLTASTPATPITGAYTGAWANGIGSRVVWQTGEIGPKRRIRGATYLVPYGGILDNDGTLTATASADLLTNATALITNLASDDIPLIVYSYTRQDPAVVTAAVVTDKVVVLRTRRD